MTSSCPTFQEAIRAAGLEPPELIEPGRIHRFPGRGKRRDNRAAWCRLFTDGKGGCFGDFSSGIHEAWFSREFRGTAQNFAPAIVSPKTTTRARDDNERRLIQQEAAQKAAYIWSRATPAESHPYLRLKEIKPYSSRLYKGVLALPILTFEGTLVSLQFIDAKGNKRFLKGGRKQGCFIPVSGPLDEVHRVVICEGFATGCTLAEDHPDSLIIAAIDAGNLASVAQAARRRWPRAIIVIAGDDDRLTEGNPGATKAREAALACGGHLILPQWPESAPASLTDFNDLAVWRRRTKQ